MDIKLYKNASPKEVLRKNLYSETLIENVRFKDDGSLSVTHPTLILNIWTDVDSCRSFNYCYIPKFKRYYYITNISFVGSLAKIECTVDVLMTYKEDILKSTQYVNRQQNKINRYLVDNMLPIHSDHRYYIHQIGDSIFDKNCDHVILTTIGG